MSVMPFCHWQAASLYYKHSACTKKLQVGLHTNIVPKYDRVLGIKFIQDLSITLTLLDLTKSYKNYLQNTQHVVLRNRPTLPLGAERLACLNSPPTCSWGPSPSTRQVPGSSPGPGGRTARAFFLHPPFLYPLGDSFFRTFPTKPVVRLGLNKRI